MRNLQFGLIKLCKLFPVRVAEFRIPSFCSKRLWFGDYCLDIRLEVVCDVLNFTQMNSFFQLLVACNWFPSPLPQPSELNRQMAGNRNWLLRTFLLRPLVVSPSWTGCLLFLLLHFGSESPPLLEHCTHRRCLLRSRSRTPPDGGFFQVPLRWSGGFLRFHWQLATHMELLHQIG